MRRLVSWLQRCLLPALLAPTVASACPNPPCSPVRVRRALLVSAVPALLAVLLAVAPSAAAADVSSAGLRRGDLPSGFRTVSQDALADAGLRSDELGESLASAFENASMQCFRVFANEGGSELVESFVVGPMTAAEVSAVDADLGDRDAFIDMITDSTSPSFATQSSPSALNTGSIGDVTVGMSVRLHTDGETAWLGTVLGGKSNEAQEQMVIGRRGDYLLAVILMHVGADQPESDIIELATVLDDRLAHAQGIGGRESEFVASVPLPTEVSRDPGVVGTNLVLALVFAIGFGFTSTVFNSTLRENNEALRRWARPILAPVTAGAGRLATRTTSRLGGSGAAGRSPVRRLIEPLSIVLLAALVYSFLEPSFSFSASGLQLFLSLLVSVAVVTYVYEGVQCRLCRNRYHAPAALKLYPAALLIAVACVIVSRLVGFSPGYLYGFVGAMAFLTVVQPSVACRGRMVLVASLGLIAVSVGAWFLAIPLSDAAAGGAWLMRLLQGTAVAVFVAGLESVFFGLIPLSFMDGETLLRWRRPLWLALFAVVAFMFWHVLLNKDSEYAAAFSGQSTRVMVAVLAGFTVLTVALHLYFRRRRGRVAAGSTEVAMPGSGTAAVAALAVSALAAPAAAATPAVEPSSSSATPAVEPSPAVAPFAAAPPVAAPPAVAPSAPPPVAAPPPAAPSAPAPPAATIGSSASAAQRPVAVGGMKACPACGREIRAAARLCRFCRASFELLHSGYCTACHGIVATDEGGICATCGARVVDLRVETRPAGWSSSPGGATPAAAVASAAAVWSSPTQPGGVGRPLQAAPKPGRTARRALTGEAPRPVYVALPAGVACILAGLALCLAWEQPWHADTGGVVLFYENPPGLLGCGLVLMLLGVIMLPCVRRRGMVIALGVATMAVAGLAVYVTLWGRTTLVDAGVAVGDMYYVALAISAVALLPGLVAVVAALAGRKRKR